MYPPNDGDPRRLVDLAVRAEQAGFDAAWIGDSLLAKPRAEPLSVLAAVAVATERIDIGTAVLLASMRNPVRLAQQAATVDALSNSRLILGIGAGPGGDAVQTDFELVDADFSRRGTRMMEIVDNARELWSGEGVDELLRLQPVCASPSGPRIWLGGAGPKSLERAGRECDGWFPMPVYPPGVARRRHPTRPAHRAAARAPQLTVHNARAAQPALRLGLRSQP